MIPVSTILKGIGKVAISALPYAVSLGGSALTGKILSDYAQRQSEAYNDKLTEQALQQNAEAEKRTIQASLEAEQRSERALRDMERRQISERNRMYGGI